MPDITHPAIFVEAITAIQQLIERVKLVPENGELKIKLYGELGALLKLGTEPKKNKDPLAESKGVQIKMVRGRICSKPYDKRLGMGSLRGRATAVTCTLILRLSKKLLRLTTRFTL